MPALPLLLNIILNGIAFSMILFLLAVGFELMFGVIRIINMAHGPYFMVGAYAGIFVAILSGFFGLGILAGAVSVGVLGLIMERFFLRYLQEYLHPVFLTFGVVFILSDITRMIWGGDPHGISTPTLLAGSVEILGKHFLYTV